jgi:hypothetical protein
MIPLPGMIVARRMDSPENSPARPPERMICARPLLIDSDEGEEEGAGDAEGKGEEGESAAAAVAGEGEETEEVQGQQHSAMMRHTCRAQAVDEGGEGGALAAPAPEEEAAS